MNYIFPYTCIVQVNAKLHEMLIACASLGPWVHCLYLPLLSDMYTSNMSLTHVNWLAWIFCTTNDWNVYFTKSSKGQVVQTTFTPG